MNQFAVASSTTIVEIPHFVDVAFKVLPAFYEAVGLGHLLIRRMEFSPDQRGERLDPPQGVVTFEPSLVENTKITFTVKYRPGEEGTRGSLSRLDEIEYYIGEKGFLFRYLEHHCHCRHCLGMKYPFFPIFSVVRTEFLFDQMSDEGRLHAIRRYVGKE